MRFFQILNKNKFLEVLAILAAMLILLMFNWRILVTQELMAQNDTIHSYGQFYYLADSISHGIFPYWNPYMNAGEPNFISLNAGNFLSPVVILWILLASFFKFSFLIAWHWIFFTYFLIFALGCYFLFRRVFEYKVSAYIAFITILFSSLSTIFWWQWGFIYIVYTLPWVLFFTFELLDKNKIYSLIPLAFSLGISCLSLYSVFFLFFYIVFLCLLFLIGAFPNFDWRLFKRHKKLLVLAILIFMAIVIHLLPVFLYKNDIVPVARMENMPSIIAEDIRPTFGGLGGAASAMFDFVAPFFPYFFLNFFDSRLFWPNSQEPIMYIGIISLIFLLIGIFCGRHKYKLGIILTAVLTMFLMLGKKFFVLQFAYYFFPGFSLIRNMEFFMPYFIFLLVFLVGMGVDRVSKDFYENKIDRLKKYLKLPIILFGLYIILLGSLIFVIYFLALPRLESIITNESLGTRLIGELSISLSIFFESFWHALFFLSGAIFFFYILQIKDILFRNKILILVFFIIFELLSLNYVLMKHVTQPRTVDVPQYQTPIKYEDFRLAKIKNDEIFAWYGPALYKKFTAYIDKIPTCTHFVELKDFYYFKKTQIPNAAKSIILGIIAPKLKLLNQGVVASSEEIISLLEKDDDRAVSQAVFLEKSPPQPHTFLIKDFNKIDLNQPANPGKIETIKFNPNELVLRVFVPNDSFLYYSDGYDKYWRAFVDDKETEVYKTNLAFKAVIVEKGEHTVKFLYDPRLFKIGLYLYLMVLVGGAGILICCVIRKLSAKNLNL